MPRLGDEHGYKRYSGLIGKAVRLLKKGEQLPSDLMVALILVGIDVGALEARYGA